jgi:hypothetical protein
VKVGGGKTEIYTFDYNYVREQAKSIPGGTQTTKTGYPHEYHNLDHQTWATSPNQATCASPKTKTLGFPVLAQKGKKPPPFKYNESKNSSPLSSPGPCRIIKTETGGTFCGIICHIEYNWEKPGSETDKGFNECKPL